MQTTQRSKSAQNLNSIYNYNKRLSRSHHRYVRMIENVSQIGSQVDWRQHVRLEKLRQHISRIKSKRQEEIFRIYSDINRKNSLTSATLTNPEEKFNSASVLRFIQSPRTLTTERSGRRVLSAIPRLAISKIIQHENTVRIEMHEKRNSIELNPNDEIIYPDDVVDRHPYEVVARFRRTIGKNIDFLDEPIAIGEDKTETLILGLDQFLQRLDCQLILTNDEMHFDQSFNRVICGTADLGSLHLLATNSLLTAFFTVDLNVPPEKEFLQSKTKIQTFVENFSHEMSMTIPCDINQIRVFSICSTTSENSRFSLQFGLTNIDYQKTQNLAKHLQKLLKIGFNDENTLKLIVPQCYHYQWRSGIKYFLLNPSDLAFDHNIDYRPSWVSVEEKRGGHPYHLPRTWYLHALRVNDKYEPDQKWIGRVNRPGEYSIAYYGTKELHRSNFETVLRTDSIRLDFIKQQILGQIGENDRKLGIYVTTHCEGGSHPFCTERFTVKTASNKEQFFMLFQCLALSDKATSHIGFTQQGRAWRFVDPHFIRPFGILLKKDDGS